MKKNKKLKILIVVIVLVIIAVIITVALSNQGHRVIKVESVEGAVVLEREDSEKNIFEDMNLQSEDTITTGADGLIGLLADSDKHIAAVENTCFAIVSNGNNKEGMLKIELKYGTSLIEIENKLPDGCSFEVETPNAALSVRGTTFEVTYIPETNTTILKVTEGLVQAESNTEMQMVPAGSSAVITDDHITLSVDNVGYGEAIPIEPEEGVVDTEEPEETLEGTYINVEDLSALLKGGADEAQLADMLFIAKLCKDDGNEDYLSVLLKNMCYTTSSEGIYQPVSQTAGSYIYDIPTLNERLSFMTDEEIGEEHLYMDSYIDGNELICVYPDSYSLDEGGSMMLSSACYGANNEIIVSGQYTHIDMLAGGVETGEVTAHLIPDENGKYILDYIE